MNVKKIVEELATALGYVFTADKEAELQFITARGGYDIEELNKTRQAMGGALLNNEEIEDIYVTAIKESFSIFRGI